MQSFENIIDTHLNGSLTRRERILDAAARAFAAHGYRATSLRDIAKDAGCSLTLLDHHFGSKAMLLEAVVKGQHENCHKRLEGLKELLTPGKVLEFDNFVAVWVNYEFDLYATREGRQYLRLMLKLSADQEVDAGMRRNLNCSEVLVLQAFARERPALPADALHGGWFMASGALYSAITSADHQEEPVDEGSPPATRGRTIAFLVDGLRGCWSANAVSLAAMSD